MELFCKYHGVVMEWLFGYVAVVYDFIAYVYKDFELFLNCFYQQDSLKSSLADARIDLVGYFL